MEKNEDGNSEKMKMTSSLKKMRMEIALFPTLRGGLLTTNGRQLGTGFENNWLKNFRRRFKLLSRPGTPPDLIFLETRHLEHLFKKRIKSIEKILSSHEFFENGVLIHIPLNFRFHHYVPLCFFVLKEILSKNTNLQITGHFRTDNA